MYSRSHSIIDIRIVGMVSRGRRTLLLLLVQILHDPGFRSNELGGRDTELHQLGKCGSKATNEPGC